MYHGSHIVEHIATCIDTEVQLYMSLVFHKVKQKEISKLYSALLTIVRATGLVA